MFRLGLQRFCSGEAQLIARELQSSLGNNTKLCYSKWWPQHQRNKAAVSVLMTSMSSHVTRPVAASFATKTKAKRDEEAMFCFQCEQTKSRKGCVEIGVCGKTPDVAALQDLLVHVVMGVCLYGHHSTLAGAMVPTDVHDFTFSALFSTLTNVNFDHDRFPGYISQALAYRDQMKQLYEAACQKSGTTPKSFTQTEATWTASPETLASTEKLIEEGKQFGVLADKEVYGADLHGVRQMTIYGVKGMATYARHARLLGEWDDSVGEFAQKAFAFLVDGEETERQSLAKNLELALEVGGANLTGMKLLDQGHRNMFGVPGPAQVRTTPVPGKAIVVSGHDMRDLSMILEAVEGTGINVYTHGEMLPAHSYPGLRKYTSLAGHFGGAWQLQKYEFPKFPGPVVVTTNCIVEPMKSYKDRLYTMNDVGWPGCKHIELPRDIDLLIEKAKEMDGYLVEDCIGDEKNLTIGFGHEAIISNAGTVIEAVKSGALKRVFVIGGCDGAEQKRNYFTTLADSLPPETLILTLGCAKFRFNSHEFGTLGDSGIPRLLDMGQCNDTYGAVVVAQALAEAFQTDINSLPLSISLSWFEQKAVAVLLTMLHLGVKNIRVGPVLPAFLTPSVVDILVEHFNLTPVDIKNPRVDMEEMMK